MDTSHIDTSEIDTIVSTVLYEGYLLYPYRPSLKNRRRWMFGVVDPASPGSPHDTPESGTTGVDCLIEGSEVALIEVEIRFLHLVDRRVAVTRGASDAVDREHGWEFVESHETEGRTWQSWEEAIERRVPVGKQRLSDLDGGAARIPFAFSGQRRVEFLPTTAEGVRGAVVREQQSIAGAVEIRSMKLADHVRRIAVRVFNESLVAGADAKPALEAAAGRSSSPARSLISVHAILSADGAQFVSMIDPPEELRPHLAGAGRQGLWPVLVGPPGGRRQMLASPIILYDYPQIAGESPGDAFDATEMDEMLALRMLTLTDAEKRGMSDLDERSKALLRRTEALSQESLRNLHGKWIAGSG